MCNIPPLGAYIKGTNEYIYPKIATKTTKYECPCCHKDLMIKKGSIRIQMILVIIIVDHLNQIYIKMLRSY